MMMNWNKLQQQLLQGLNNPLLLFTTKEREDSITASSNLTTSNDGGNNTIIILSATTFILGLLSLLYYHYWHLSFNNHVNEKQKVGDKATSTTSNITTLQRNQVPYTQLGHPLKYNVDKLVSILFPLLFPFDSLCQESYFVASRNEQQYKSSSSSPSSSSLLTKMRKRIERVESKLHTISCHLWNWQCQKNTISSNKKDEDGKTISNVERDFLVGGTIYVPRQENILKDWNIIPKINKDDITPCDEKKIGITDTLLQNARSGGVKDNKNNFIEIEITCPASCIRNKEEILSSSSSPPSLSSSSSAAATGTASSQHHSNSWRQRLAHGYQNIFPSSSSFIQLSDIKFEKGCPIIIYFHGGGMVCGTSRDGTFISDFVSKLYETKSLSPPLPSPSPSPSLSSLPSSSLSNSTKGIIVLSVTYRLAPEHPFPSSIIDCLSAASSVIEYTRAGVHNNNNNIHIAGFSAGGQLSTVVGLECYRRYPGTIKSIVPLDPMLLPHADTLSYHLNSLSSSCCPAKFVRWCWSAYLQLKVENEDGDDGDRVKSLLSPTIDFGDVQEYKKMLEKNPWFQPYIRQTVNRKNTSDKTSANYNSLSVADCGLTRLFFPRIDLPKKLNEKEAPVIIVKTSTADVLRDDGCDLVRALRDAGTNVIHFDMVGSHGISSLFGNNNNDLIDIWSKIIWNKDE